MELLTYVLGFIQGFGISYIMFAPETPFKRGFVDGISLKFIRKRFRS